MKIEKNIHCNIKPSSPTPDHLKIYKLSALDQTFCPYYVRSVLFYQNNNATNMSNVMSNRLQHLRLSLSDILTRFYPFAGRIKNELYVDCNDEGINYVEARVNDRLSNLLLQPNDKLLSPLIPEINYNVPREYYHVMLIQVNVFDCGGIAFGLCTCHKIVDALTCTTFMKAWAATARGSADDQVICPSFSIPSVFPQNVSLTYKWPLVHNKDKHTHRRFVFYASSLASLRAKVANSSSQTQRPTRVGVVSALLWKCAMDATSKARGSNQGKTITPSVLAIAVNLRGKTLPPLSQYSVGNCVWYSFPQYLHSSKLELCTVVDCIAKTVGEINTDFVEELKGHQGFKKVGRHVKESCEFVQSVDKADFVYLTSMCNSGTYQLDFGWGKPVWYSCSSAGFTSLIALQETRSGDGIEAFVTLPEHEMAIFERDPQLLAFSTMDPSPLELIVSNSRL